MSESRFRYAAYGSNLHPLRLRARLPTAALLGDAFVPGYSLRFDKRSRDGSAKCGIDSGGDGVHVAVFEVSQSEQLALDEIEGVGHGYERFELEVPGFGNCFTYAATPSHLQPGLPAYDWYREFVLVGCRSHGFPADYIAAIEAKIVTHDPDRERRRRSWEVVARMHDGHGA